MTDGSNLIRIVAGDDHRFAIDNSRPRRENVPCLELHGSPTEVQRQRVFQPSMRAFKDRIRREADLIREVGAYLRSMELLNTKQSRQVRQSVERWRRILAGSDRHWSLMLDDRNIQISAALCVPIAMLESSRTTASTGLAVRTWSPSGSDFAQRVGADAIHPTISVIRPWSHNHDRAEAA